MPRIDVPKLDLPTVVDGLCKFLIAGKMELAACKNQVEGEIDRQMAVFVDTHTRVTALLTGMHQTTQALYRNSETMAKRIFAQDDARAEDLAALIDTL